MEKPFYTHTLVIPHETQQQLGDCAKKRVCFDLTQVVGFEETTYNNAAKTEALYVNLRDSWVTIVTTYDEFVIAMQEAGMLPK